MDGIKLDKNALRLPHGSKWKGGNRCTSVNLTQETKDAIDELVPSKYRSAWIERWCQLGIAIQNKNWVKAYDWAKWATEATGRPLALWIEFDCLCRLLRRDE